MTGRYFKNALHAECASCTELLVYLNLQTENSLTDANLEMRHPEFYFTLSPKVEYTKHIL